MKEIKLDIIRARNNIYYAIDKLEDAIKKAVDDEHDELKRELNHQLLQLESVDRSLKFIGSSYDLE